jgi:flagellar hook protein FlgE
VVNTAGTPGNIQIPAGQLLAPTATTQFSVAMNLDASATAGAATGTFSTPIPAVDSLGNAVNMTVTFTKDPTTPNQWTYQVTVPGNITTAGTAGTPTSLLTTPGTLTFDSGGKLTTPAVANGQIPIAITGLTDSAADMNINFSLYDSNGNSMITQFSQPSAVSASKQNGQTASELTGVGMSNGGLITATYSNGTQLTVAQLAVASIQNPGSLAQVGNNDFAATGLTGQPAVGTADTGGRGQIMGQSLEASNADIATEFTNLITYQRAYEANSKVVTTEDALTQDTIGLLPAA